ncbi:hypothetical protein GCM10010324_36020 [Streptomyces hiroshimensis]|uniref:MABP domain-containing protein n=2 Tax=Streptomyces hiroshimensis TaxID=66424 RepID=A0ABQ2YMN2_9ACTN|nr:hypothetical protein GCM10010324_36020 [Streptomyces hiroshimensis]
MDYICDLQVVNGKDRQPPKDWTRIPTNLNEGAGGSFLYFAFKTSDDRSQAITDIRFCQGDKPKPDPGYQLIDTDLNEKTTKHGSAIWAAFTHDPVAGAPLTELDVHAGDMIGYQPELPWFRIDQDLNHNAGGKYVYLLYTTV